MIEEKRLLLRLEECVALIFRSSFSQIYIPFLLVFWMQFGGGHNADIIEENDESSAGTELFGDMMYTVETKKLFWKTKIGNFLTMSSNLSAALSKSAYNIDLK